MYEQRPGTRGRTWYDDLTGYPSLAAAIMKDAAKHDRDWFAKDPIAVHFWCDVAGISYEAFSQAFDRWKTNQAVGVEPGSPSLPSRTPILLSLYRDRRRPPGD